MLLELHDKCNGVCEKLKECGGFFVGAYVLRGNVVLNDQVNLSTSVIFQPVMDPNGKEQKKHLVSTGQNQNRNNKRKLCFDL